MEESQSDDLVHDLFLPTLLFAALGGMSWAVRGCSGFGGSAGCIFAGVLWGAAWWFIARDPAREQSRRYSSGWIVLAVTIGVGISGARGWMQWPSFFEGKLYTDWAAGEFVPISRAYGFLWLFIAGVPWAGIGACMLAWCGSIHETRIWHWGARIAFGVGGAMLARYLFDHYPAYFLPLYDSMETRYLDLENNPNLRRLINDSGSAIVHLGLYLGFLLFEVARRDAKNVLLIAAVGLANGVGWALFQNWKWAPALWPDARPNWWRCWESSGGISIGVAYGLAYFLVNRPMPPDERARFRAARSIAGPNLEWLAVFLAITSVLAFVMYRRASGWTQAAVYVLMAFALLYVARWRGTYYQKPSPEGESLGDPNLERLGWFLGLLLGLGFSLRNGLKGCMNLYQGREWEEYWGSLLWKIIGPAMLVFLVAFCIRTLLRPLPRGYSGDLFPRAAAWMWLVLLFQNILAQLVTGPLSQWNEMMFSFYYLLLFLITAVITFHYSFLKRLRPAA